MNHLLFLKHRRYRLKKCFCTFPLVCTRGLLTWFVKDLSVTTYCFDLSMFTSVHTLLFPFDALRKSNTQTGVLNTDVFSSPAGWHSRRRHHNLSYACVEETAAAWAWSHGHMCSAVTAVTR